MLILPSSLMSILQPVLRDDVFNDFTAGADDFADLVDRNRDRGDLRSVLRQRGARSVDGFGHFTQDVQTAFVRLSESGSHDVFVDAFDLDVHLNAGDAVFGSSDFEIHIAEMIFVTQECR